MIFFRKQGKERDKNRDLRASGLMVRGKTIILFLFIPSIMMASHAYSEERKYVVLSLDDVVSYAKEKDLEIKNLTFKIRELVRSKKNLYRSFFPTISTSFNTSKIVTTGEVDSRSYDFNVTLNQVLYDQFSSPMMFKNYGISLEDAKLNIRDREKSIKKEAVSLYLEILIQEARQKNKKEEYRLYRRFLQLMREEYRMGMRTILEVVATERNFLQVELELEELSSKKEILYKDLMDFIGFDNTGYQVVMSNDADSIISSLLGLNGSYSFREVYEYLAGLEERINDKEHLFATAVHNNFEIKKLNLSLRQNLLKKKLLSIQYLENISFIYGIDFTGEYFFPANTTHRVGVNILLDFGVLSSDVSVSESTSDSFRSESGTAESEVLKSFNLMDRGKYLKIESYTAAERMKEARKGILKQIEVWIIKKNSLMKLYAIKLKQRDIFDKNEELFRLKLLIGEVKEIDYMEFLFQKNEFLIELEELKYRFINLIWEFEDILNVKITEITG